MVKIFLDLRVGKYIRLDSKKPCLHLCTSLNNIDDNDEEKNKTEENCCDALAECTCGTTSGHLACLCPPGYYGSGLRGSCHREKKINKFKINNCRISI